MLLSKHNKFFRVSLFYSVLHRLTAIFEVNCRNFGLLKRSLSTLSNVSTTQSGESKMAFIEYLGEEDKGIAVVNLDRPTLKNALSRQMIGDLRNCINELKSSNIRTAIVRSRVDNIFCAGADLTERRMMKPNEVPDFVSYLRNTFSELERLPMPTIAAIDGFALGGGLEMALACDMRISSEKAKMGLPETGLAIFPAAGGTQRLPRLIGIARAKELIFTGRILNSQEAREYGMINEVVVGSSFDRSLTIARHLLKQGPIALRLAKRAIQTGINVTIENGMKIEAECYEELIPTNDRLEGLNAFLEKRKPNYQGN